MSTRAARNAVAIALIGGAYYLLHAYLVGIAAAIALPDQYHDFAQQYTVLTLIMFAMMTTVPAAALAAIPAGFLISRVTTKDAVLSAIAVIIGVTLLYAHQSDVSGALRALKAIVLPSSVIEMPLIVAWWTFLPLSAAFFASRVRRERR